MKNLSHSASFHPCEKTAPLNAGIKHLGFDTEIDELEMAGLEAVACARIDVDRINTAPCAFECRVERLIEYPRRVLVLGEVVHMHVRGDCLDRQGRYVNPEVYQPIARLHADNYITSDRQFILKAPAITDFLTSAQAKPR